jgi:uncharacterized protein YheU (UPF0270 family)
MTTDQKQSEQNEEGLEIPFEKINPGTLRKMIEEFVTRQWEGTEDTGQTLDAKVDQVLRQLQFHTARVVYDIATESWNIVAS